MDIKTKLYFAKEFDNNLAVITKNKVRLTLNKPAYAENVFWN